MRDLIGINAAGNALLVIYGLLAIVHGLVLARVLPSRIVWGGRATGSHRRLVLLEAVALILTALSAAVVAVRLGYLPGERFDPVVRVLVWVLFSYTLLNLVGNLTSGGWVERLVFGPVTLGVALLLLRLAIG